MQSLLSTEVYLKKLSKEHRDIIAKKVGIVLNMLHSDNFGECKPSLEQCFALLGRMQTRRRMLHKVVDMLHFFYGRYSALKPWPKELYDLREQCKKQIELMEKLIDCYLIKGGTTWEDMEDIQKEEEKDAVNDRTEPGRTESAGDPSSCGAVG